MGQVTWDKPPEPVTQPQVLPGPVLYNAQTGKPLGQRYQRFVSGFSLPGGQRVNVTFGRAPNYQSSPAAMVPGATPDQDTIYFDRRQMRGNPRKSKRLLLHELAHQSDTWFMTDTARQQFADIMGDKRWWRDSSENPPYEQFADAAASYAMGYKRAKMAASRGYNFHPTRQQWRQLRRLFDQLDG